MTQLVIFIMLWLIAMCGWIFCLIKWRKSDKNKLSHILNEAKLLAERNMLDKKVTNLNGELMSLAYKEASAQADLNACKIQAHNDGVDEKTDDLIRRFRIKAYANRKDQEDFDWYISLRAWFRRFASFGEVYLTTKVGEREYVKAKEYEIGEQTRQLILSAINDKLIEIEKRNDA